MCCKNLVWSLNSNGVHSDPNHALLPFGTANTTMTNLLLLNDAHDDEKLPSCETSTSTRVVESPEDEISSHDPSATGQVRSPGVIDRQIESCENDSVGKEYTPPIPTWKLFTIVFGYVPSLSTSLHFR